LDFNDPSVAAFWSKVDVKANDLCWNWLGAKRPGGYGNLRYKNKYVSAHRLSWELNFFPVPDGFCVCHVCDNPSCVNPGHLMLGNKQSNTTDMIKKNRQEFHKNKAVGARNANSKLAEGDVINIRTEYQSGKFNQYELADRYGVKQSTIGCIVRNKTWKHINEGTVK